MRRATFERGMASILKDKPFSPQLFEPTSALMDFNNAKLEDIPIAKNLTLPQECYEWANRMASQLSDDFFIVQPYSINSTTKEAHWPHWHELIQWISGDFSQDYVLAGNNWDSHLYQGMGHVKNMVNHFPTVCHLYALAEKSKGVITTSNSLAHWCVSQNVPVTVIANIVSSEPNYFFRKVIHGDCVIYFTYYSPFQRVVFSLNERWGIWPAEAMQ